MPPAANPAVAVVPRAPVDASRNVPAIATNGPVGGRRPKPVPAFRYARREEPVEPFPVAPPDMDDPLASVFFPDARDALDESRPYDPLEVPVSGSDADAYTDEDDDDFDDEDDGYDELPPSLSRAVHPSRGRRAVWRSPGLLWSLAGLGTLAVMGVVGFNVLAGAGGSAGEPRVIHADARDVKVRPDETAIDPEDAARPDITERAALGESDRLVVPDQVRVDTSRGADRDDEEEPRTPRQVRTVVVRPDGTMVPATPIDAPAAAAAATTASADDDDVEPVPEIVDRGGADDGDGLDPYEVAAAGDAGVRTDATFRDEIGTADGPTGIDGVIATGEPDVADAAGALDDGQTELDDPVASAAAGDVVTTVPRARPTPPRRSAQRQAAIDPASAPRSEPQQFAAYDDSGLGSPAVASGQPSPTPAATVDAPWAVQLSSQRTQDDAETSFRRLQQRYPGVLGSVAPTIVAANVGDRGTFYRVRVGTQSYDEATSLCKRLKSAGADCFVERN